MTYEEMKNLLQLAKGARAQVEKEIETGRQRKLAMENRLVAVEKAQAFLQRVAKETQSELKFKVEDIVNLALETCFPGEYLFRVDFNIMRGKTEAELVFVDQKSGRRVDPMNASGGGVVDLTTFALRVACYALERECDNVIVLDEPFRFLSRDLQSRAGEILKTLSKKMGLQVIMVTHIGEIIDVADKVFEVKKGEDGVSVVREKVLA